MLLAHTLKFISKIDSQGYLFDKSLKLLSMIQNNSSFSSSCQWLGAVVYLI
jgi:hypothetical protein